MVRSPLTSQAYWPERRGKSLRCGLCALKPTSAYKQCEPCTRTLRRAIGTCAERHSRDRCPNPCTSRMTLHVAHELRGHIVSRGGRLGRLEQLLARRRRLHYDLDWEFASVPCTCGAVTERRRGATKAEQVGGCLLVVALEGFRLQGDRLLVGQIILVSGEIFFIFMIMN